MAGTTGLEPATSDVTGRRSNQLNYVPDPAYLFILTCALSKLNRKRDTPVPGSLSSITRAPRPAPSLCAVDISRRA